MGEVCSLQWKQVNCLTGDLALVLLVWKKRCEKKWPSCPWMCHREGSGYEPSSTPEQRCCAFCARISPSTILPSPTRSQASRQYNIVNENDLEAAAKSLSAYFEKQKVTLAVTVAELNEEGKSSANCKPVESSKEEDGAGERNRTSNQRFTKKRRPFQDAAFFNQRNVRLSVRRRSRCQANYTRQSTGSIHPPASRLESSHHSAGEGMPWEQH